MPLGQGQSDLGKTIYEYSHEISFRHLLLRDGRRISNLSILIFVLVFVSILTIETYIVSINTYGQRDSLVVLPMFYVAFITAVTIGISGNLWMMRNYRKREQLVSSTRLNAVRVLIKEATNISPKSLIPSTDSQFPNAYEFELGVTWFVYDPETTLFWIRNHRDEIQSGNFDDVRRKVCFLNAKDGIFVPE